MISYLSFDLIKILLFFTFHSSVDKVIARQEQIEIIVDRSETLVNSSIVFRKRSTDLKKNMWWKNCKLWILLVVIFIVCFYLFIYFYKYIYVKNIFYTFIYLFSSFY